jgi:outer membrane biosynthesis protein TonB
MTKAKTNALDALRTLIAERQQYEQWISALDSRREGTPEHVFERVRGDYQSRLEKVVNDIKGHAEELQLSISTLSSRLVEVAREEDTRREGLQEAELRAAVGEYQPEQWEQLKSDAERELARIAADRSSLDSQLTELRAIQKLSEVGSTAAPTPAPAPEMPAEPPKQEVAAPVARAAEPPPAVVQKPEPAAEPAPAAAPPAATADLPSRDAESRARKPEQTGLGFDSMASAASAAAAATSRPRSGKTPPAGVPASKGKSEAARPDGSKTLKCPECGTANYPTEWYCERCGGELATM